MNKKKYISPEIVIIEYRLLDILANSPIDPHEPQDPVVSGDKGGDLDF